MLEVATRIYAAAVVCVLVAACGCEHSSGGKIPDGGGHYDAGDTTYSCTAQVGAVSLSFVRGSTTLSCSLRSSTGEAADTRVACGGDVCECKFQTQTAGAWSLRSTFGTKAGYATAESARPGVWTPMACN